MSNDLGFCKYIETIAIVRVTGFQLLAFVIILVQPPRKRAHKAEGSVYVRRGVSFQDLREVDALDFVRRPYIIPIPSVIDVHIDEERYESKHLVLHKRDPWLSSFRRMVYHEPRSARRPRQIFMITSTNFKLCLLQSQSTSRLIMVVQHMTIDSTMAILVARLLQNQIFNGFLVAPVARCPRKELVTYYHQQLTPWLSTKGRIPWASSTRTASLVFVGGFGKGHFATVDSCDILKYQKVLYRSIVMGNTDWKL
ncbi:hypothetical protein BKA64DRAFT_721807 [Cadophora sp. MPI-SDFR-AT-0126]|nr:hypothetical protein BKA64DRAFT_721807 [Leotiomycetes sp. MPI-SDFR-AT-0126]